MRTPRTPSKPRAKRRPAGAHPSRRGLERERILDAALGQVFTRGLRRMRMAELARGLGVVPSALHYHFPRGKDELIAAVFDREESRLLAAMERAVAASRGLRGQLLALARARLQYAARLARLYPINESIGDEIESFVRQRRHRFLEHERELMGRVFRGATGAERFSESSIDLLAAACQGALFNVTRAFALTQSRKSQAVLAEAIDLLLRGMGRS